MPRIAFHSWPEEVDNWNACRGIFLNGEEIRSDCFFDEGWIYVDVDLKEGDVVTAYVYGGTHSPEDGYLWDGELFIDDVLVDSKANIRETNPLTYVYTERPVEAGISPVFLLPLIGGILYLLTRI